ncbi:MAG TPA: ATP synthase subunit I [Verrucomicrobiae bacterium]|nr:ATP synthase subunit I [Verrucomicrobiae bacterium]
MDYSVWLGLLVGLMIGGVYALWQLRALARHEKFQREQGQLPRVASMLPGSFTRIAVLLIVLVLAQVVFPKASVLWVAVGVAIGYGVPFAWRLKGMLSKKK